MQIKMNSTLGKVEFIFCFCYKKIFKKYLTFLFFYFVSCNYRKKRSDLRKIEVQERNPKRDLNKL